MIKAVSFDLWFTLIWETKEDEELYVGMRIDSIKKFLRDLGKDFPVDGIRRAYHETRDFRMVLPPEDLLRMLFMKLGVSLSGELLSEAVKLYVESTDEFKPKLNEEAPEVLRELKKAGFKLAIVSNTSFSARSIRGILRNIGLDLFDVIISSADVGMIKPQRGIFELLAKGLELSSCEIIHVGDSCYQDVIGALSSGLEAAYYPRLVHLRGGKEQDLECPFRRIDSLWQLLEILKV